MNKSNTTLPKVAEQELVKMAAQGTLWAKLLTMSTPEKLDYLKTLESSKVVTKDLHVFDSSPTRRALYEIQPVMSALSNYARGACNLGRADWTEASAMLRKWHDDFGDFRACFAAELNEAYPELVCENTTIVTQSGDFDIMRSLHPHADWGDDNDDDDDDDDSGDSYESAAYWDKEAQECDSGPRSQKFSTSEGLLPTALHTPEDVLRVEPHRTNWSDYRYSPVAFHGLEWPAHLDIWDDFLERFAESQLRAIDSQKTPLEKEEMTAKAKKRAYVLTTPVEKSRMKEYTRWALSAACRRIWRDVNGPIKGRMTSLDDRLERIVEQHGKEERDTSIVPYWTRLVTERPDPREINLLYKKVLESDLWSTTERSRSVMLEYSAGVTEECAQDKSKALAYTRDKDGAWVDPDALDTLDCHHMNPAEVKSRFEYERAWIVYQLSTFEQILKELEELYSILRTWEVSASPLWDWSLRTPNRSGAFNAPEAPPVYWNRDGFYLTEEDAIAALRAEEETLAERAKGDELDAFAAAALMLAAQDGLTI